MKILSPSRQGNTAKEYHGAVATVAGQSWVSGGWKEKANSLAKTPSRKEKQKIKKIESVPWRLCVLARDIFLPGVIAAVAAVAGGPWVSGCRKETEKLSRQAAKPPRKTKNQKIKISPFAPWRLGERYLFFRGDCCCCGRGWRVLR